MIELAEKLYNGRRKAVKNGELILKDFSSDITEAEKELINNLSTDFSFHRCTKSQLLFTKDDELYRFARFGCGDKIFDGIRVNKREYNIARKYIDLDIFLYPERYSKYVYKTKFIEKMSDTDLEDMKKTDALTYVTDIVDENVDEINAFDLHKSNIGYDANKNQVYIIDYGYVVKSIN